MASMRTGDLVMGRFRCFLGFRSPQPRHFRGELLARIVDAFPFGAAQVAVGGQFGKPAGDVERLSELHGKRPGPRLCSHFEKLGTPVSQALHAADEIFWLMRGDMVFLLCIGRAVAALYARNRRFAPHAASGEGAAHKQGNEQLRLFTDLRHDSFLRPR